MWIGSEKRSLVYYLSGQTIIKIDRVYHIKFSDFEPRWSAVVNGIFSYDDTTNFGAEKNLELLKFKCLVKAKEIGWNIKNLSLGESNVV